MRVEEGRTMRGDDRNNVSLFSYLSPEARVPKDHPLRAIRQNWWKKFFCRLWRCSLVSR